jgi:arylsulfatase A-like enzyme
MSDKPHVLLVCTDHWPGRLLGCEGHPVVQTPTIDELADNGTRFTRAYSECPVCIPARRTLMTGTAPRTHGDRVFLEEGLMPALPTLAQVFRDAGYQAYASGKLHVFPQRNRIGFDDVMLGEEGRAQWGVVDDYELFLGDHGYAGRQFAHGMSNNQYVTRPWHLPEQFHNTNWTADQMERFIKRRDPTRPGFWYLSFAHPHPPLAPLASYLAEYRHLEVDEPVVGEWAQDPEGLPPKLRRSMESGRHLSPDLVRAARRAFYALCTHIDHQIRRVIGTLREEGLLGDTIILFTADHGDMLGDHRLWAKRLFYDGSARVPMILCTPPGDSRVAAAAVDDRLVGLRDVMPTLLDLCGIPVPDSVEGLSMAGTERRRDLYGEEGEGPGANRMMVDGRHKLIYYPVGNRRQLFDLDDDPFDSRDLASEEDSAEVLERLTGRLVEELHGSDRDWLEGSRLVGLPDRPYGFRPVPGLFGQRGGHWPPPPASGLKIENLKEL